MRRPRRGGPVLSQAPLPQAWVPRVVNAALAIVLLLFVSPVVTQFDGKRGYVQVVLVAVTVPVVLLAAACLCSAARPGSLGRAVRRLRARRRRS
jgi:hypothetical protein